MDDLERLLQQRAARAAMNAAAPSDVPQALMARILADAARVQPRSRPAPPPLRFGQVLADLFGGAGVLAGMATAACAGIYLGLAQPSALGLLTLALAGESAVDQLDFMPSIDTFLAEE